METTAVLGALALAALVAAAGCLVQLHRIAPEVVPVRDAVSDYGAGLHASWYRAQVVLVGLAAAAVAAGLTSLDLRPGGVGWLYVFAASRILIAGFPVDLPGAERTTTGAVHNVLATVAFASIAVAASTIASDLVGDPAWSLDGTWYRWTGTVVVVAAVALGIAWVAPGLRRSLFGFVERCWYVAAIGWLGLTAIGLLLA